jgi:hypothetical protein
MIFTPFVIFGHTWEVDAANKCISALIDKKLFYKYFIKNGHKSSHHFLFGNNDYISLVLTFHNIKKKQIKVEYEIDCGWDSKELRSLILSQPLTEKEKHVLHSFRSLCYQYHEQISLIDNSKPKNIRDLELQDMDSLNNYTIKIEGIDDDMLVYKLFDWMYKEITFFH